MATTFVFEELDQATHEYLMAVRDAEGGGSPGVFIATSDSLPGCGCIVGPILIIVTLMFTLTTWLGIIYDDPGGVALLQTAGLLLGGWLLVAGFRGSSRGGQRMAGTWIYADPMYLYEAFREQVTVTPIEEVVEANFTHNYSNGSYQNSVVNIALGGNRVATVTVNNEARAEQMVVYLNYLAWARGPEGGERANLPPATLGGLAKYVARNDHEPLDAESNINLNMIELDINEVPEQPTREGRAIPAFLPYIFILLFGVLCFFGMRQVNIVFRDDAIYDVVMKETSPPSIEPRFLRAYLVDPRNTRHRDAVLKKLSTFYDAPIAHVKQNGQHPSLREGMGSMLDSLRTADQPVVSLQITETKSPAGKSDGATARANGLRTQFADGVNNAFAAQQWGHPVRAPDNMQFKEPPPPIGHQLLAFVEKPEDAPAAHIEIMYLFEPAGQGQYKVKANVSIRTEIDKNPVNIGGFDLGGTFSENELDTTAMTRLKDALILQMIGPVGGAPVLPPPPG